MAAPALRISPNLPVFTIQKKLVLESVAAFGDAEDILYDKVMRSDKDTVDFTVDVRRQFMPGNYVMHIVGPDLTLEDEFSSNSTAIVCREDVDPKLIHALLIDSNCDRNRKHPDKTRNFLNRYDWMHFRNFGCGSVESSDEDSGLSDGEKFKKRFRRSLYQRFKRNIRDLTFFINASRIDDIIAGGFTLEQESDSVIVMLNSALSNPVIGFAINTDSDADTFVAGDWNYAYLLTDSNSKQTFAFVFGDLYVNKYMFNVDKMTTFTHDVQKDQYTYNIENFLYKN